MTRFRFAMLVGALLAATVAARAQDSSAYYRTEPTAQKDGTVAFGLSFLRPGLGQVYAGEPVFGAVLFGAAVGGTALALYNAQLVERCDPATFAPRVCSSEAKNSGLVTAGFFIAAAAWVASMAEAPAAARRFNETHRVALRVDPGAGGTVRVGLSVRR